MRNLLKNGSVFQLIKEQPRIVVDKIYGCESSNSQAPFACKAVFQSLTVLSKAMVMRLIFLETSFELKDMLQWTNVKSREFHNASIEELLCLMILVTDGFSGGDKKCVEKYTLNEYFRRNFRKALSDLNEPWLIESKLLEAKSLSITIRANPPSKSELNLFSSSRWDEVLGFIVDILPPTHTLNEYNVVSVFVQRAGLMREEGPRNKLVITAAGYEFMLKDQQQQVWEFVLQAIRYSESLDDALSLLFMLSYCQFGQGYPLDALTRVQRQMVFEFSQLGLVYMRSPKTATHFYPTRVAINVIFGSHTILSNAGGELQGPESASQRMSLIVETNNQVVAYVSSELHLALLKLFVDVTVRMPNMAIGRLTREKSKQAFRVGINAAQIISFLIMHAHPTVCGRSPIVPENVTDQLTLWEAESFRIQAQEAVVVNLSEIPGTSAQTFKALVDNLQGVNVLIWSSEKSLTLAVVPEGFHLITSFFKNEFGYFS